MLNVQADLYAVDSGKGVWAGRDAPDPVTLFTAVADGVWTWIQRPQARYRNGATYIGVNTSAGSPTIHKYVHATQSSSSFALRTALQVDDHCVPTFDFLADGRIVAAYSALSDSVMRVRRSVSAEDISAWDSEQSISAPSGLNNTYASTLYLSGPGKMILLGRAHAASSTRINWYTYSSDGATWATSKLFMRGAATGTYPYLCAKVTGANRIDFITTVDHPVNGNDKVFHFYAEWSEADGDLRFYQTDGTQITATLPFDESDLSLVYDSTGRAWWSDLSVDSSGNPMAIVHHYPNSNGSDIRLLLCRWDGSAWGSAVDIVGASVGTSLYLGEAFYTSCAAFDDRNPKRFYLGRESLAATRYEMERWSTDDYATFAFDRRYTTVTAGQDAIRPVSPRGHNGEVPLLWVEGVYNTFADYETAIKGVR